MRRLLGLLFAALIWVNAVEAQELNCTVEVNSQQIEGTNKNVFDALQEGISTYMNETKFSNAVLPASADSAPASSAGLRLH